MKTLSKLALAGALVTGVSGLALATPAAAKDKKDAAPAAPGFKMSKPVAAIAQQTQTAVRSGDTATAEPLVAQLEAAATTDDDKYIAAALRYELESRKVTAARTANPNTPPDMTAFAKAVDNVIAAKNTPEADRGKFLYQRGQIAANSGQAAVAADYFNRAKQAGYNDPNLDLQVAQSKVQSGDVAGGLAALNEVITRMEGAGQKPPEDYYRYAISQSLKAKLPETTTWLRKYASAYPTPKTWYGVVLTYGLQQMSVIKPTRVQEIDLLRLLRATNALDQSTYEQYVQRTYDAGNPFEAQTVLKEGIASGKIPAASMYAKEMTADVAKAVRNEGSLAGYEKQAAASANGDLASQTGDAYLGQGNNAKAAELYRAALAKPAGKATKDDINTHLGVALARSGDKAGAAAAFGAVTSPASAGVAGLWTTYLQAGSTAAAPATPAAG